MTSRHAHWKLATAHTIASKEHGKAAANPAYVPKLVPPTFVPAGGRSLDPKGGFAYGTPAELAAEDMDRDNMNPEPEPNQAIYSEDPGERDYQTPDEGDAVPFQGRQMAEAAGSDDDGGDDDSDTDIIGRSFGNGFDVFVNSADDDAGDTDGDENIIGDGEIEMAEELANSGPDDGSDDDDDVNVIGDLSDEGTIAGFFDFVSDAASSVAHAATGAVRAVGKAGRAVAGVGNVIIHSPITKIAEVGISFVAPEVGIPLLAATAAAEKIIDAANSAADVSDKVLAALPPEQRAVVVARAAAQRAAAVRVIANTVKAAGMGHDGAQRGLELLQLVKAQQKALRGPSLKDGRPGYGGTLILFHRAKRLNGSQIKGHWQRALRPAKGVVLGTVIVGKGGRAHKLRGLWRRA
jgi:hypothetical protein